MFFIWTLIFITEVLPLLVLAVGIGLLFRLMWAWIGKLEQ